MRQPSYYKWKHTHTHTPKSPLAVNFENEWVTFSMTILWCYYYYGNTCKISFQGNILKLNHRKQMLN